MVPNGFDAIAVFRQVWRFTNRGGPILSTPSVQLSGPFTLGADVWVEATTTVRLTAKVDSPLWLTFAEPAPSAFGSPFQFTSDCPTGGAVIPAGSSCGLIVIFRPRQPGSFVAHLTIRDDPYQAPLVVPVEGIATEPQTGAQSPDPIIPEAPWALVMPLSAFATLSLIAIGLRKRTRVLARP